MKGKTNNFNVAYSQLDERYRTEDNYNYLMSNKEWVDNLNSLPKKEFNESLGMIISSIECQLINHTGELIKQQYQKKQPVMKLSKTLTDIFDL